MTSIYQAALGPEFDRLHPRIRDRFAIHSRAGVAQFGSGTMQQITRGERLVAPLLSFGATRHILFPEYGDDVPFTIHNFGYVDSFGRDAVSWNRTFDFGKRQRRFDASMVYDRGRRSIVDDLGTHQHMAVDLRCWADDELGRFRIDVDVRNPIGGHVCGYRGTFTVEQVEISPDQIPTHEMPLREEARP